MPRIRPFVICTFDYRTAEEQGTTFGYFTGECDSFGKHTFVHIRSIEEIGAREDFEAGLVLGHQLAQELGATDTRGAVVYQMSRSSSAYQAGLRPGDIIVRFNGQRVEDPSQFVRMLADTPIGSTVTIGAIREGREIEIPVKVTAQSRRRR